MIKQIFKSSLEHAQTSDQIEASLNLKNKTKTKHWSYMVGTLVGANGGTTTLSLTQSVAI